MSKELTLTVHPFRADCTDKEQAVKVLEEAAEVYGAWQTANVVFENFKTCGHGFLRDKFSDELADCITACVNMADRFGVDLQEALDRCERKNRERGRYDDGEVRA